MIKRFVQLRSISVFIASFALLASVSAQGVVTSTADSGAGTLRQAIILHVSEIYS
jgi:hypothetical protein